MKEGEVLLSIATSLCDPSTYSPGRKTAEACDTNYIIVSHWSMGVARSTLN